MSELRPIDIYAATRAELIEVGRSLGPEQADATVPATPAWSVRDVYAHVTGINADLLNQNLDGIGTDAWTEAQVLSRRSQTLAEICDEWQSYAAQIDAIGASEPVLATRATGDLIVHLHDLAMAIPFTPDRSSPGVALTFRRYLAAFGERIDEAGAATIEVRASDLDERSTAGTGKTGPTALEASAFDLMRAFSGRRSRAQVRALSWDGDEGPYLDLISAYGMPLEDLAE